MQLSRLRVTTTAVQEIAGAIASAYRSECKYMGICWTHMQTTLLPPLDD